MPTRSLAVDPILETLATLSKSTMTDLREIRNALQELDNVDLPVPVNLDESLLVRYEKSRNEYLQRRIRQAVASRIATFDGNKFDDVSGPSPEEMKSLENRKEDVLKQVTRNAQQIDEKMQQLLVKNKSLQVRKENVERMLDEMEKSGHKLDESLVDDVDEAEMDKQEQKLMTLELRKHELEIKLGTLQKESMAIEKANQQNKLQLQAQGVTSIDVQSVSSMQQENDKLRSQLSSAEEIKSFYDNLGLVMEELGGISVVKVDQSSDEMVLHVKLLHDHDVQIILKANKKNVLRVTKARFINSTLVLGPNNVQMEIPALDDLVRIAESIPGQGDDLRFVLQESIARITAIKARVQELAVLQTEVLTKIEKSYSYANTFGGEDQDVVCSLNEQITVVLRLTPDCPRVKGSVYIDQIVGLGGWSVKHLEEMKENLNQQLFSSPVELIRAVKAEIERLRNEGVTAPGTPLLPKRG